MSWNHSRAQWRQRTTNEKLIVTGKMRARMENNMLTVTIKVKQAAPNNNKNNTNDHHHDVDDENEDETGGDDYNPK